jgi:Reticulon
VADAASGAVHSAASAHDAWLTSRDPSATLGAAAALWAVSILGRLLSVWRLLALCSVAAFTVPVAVYGNRHRLDKAWRDASRAVQVGWAQGLEQLPAL